MPLKLIVYRNSDREASNIWRMEMGHKCGLKELEDFTKKVRISLL